MKISALSWNTGGILPANFKNYFLDFKECMIEKADIYIVCLQEIVQLNPTQIMSSDPEKRQLWEFVFLGLLEEYHGAGKFVTLVSNQLVGTSLMIFINSDMVDETKNVEISSIKTGLGGMAGNKGSVAVKFEISGNTFCVVGSHFTAGKKSYLELFKFLGQNASVERLKEYFYVLQELSFSKGKRIFPNE